MNTNQRSPTSPTSNGTAGLSVRVKVDDPSLHSHPQKGEGGVGLFFVEAGPRIAVLTLVDDGSAQKDGTIRPGDMITTIDGRDVIGFPLADVRQMILGRVGTRVTIGFERPVPGGQNRSYSVSLVREHAEHGGAEIRRRLELELRQEREDRMRLEERFKREVMHLRQQLDQLNAELNGERNNHARLEDEYGQRARRDVAGMRAELEEAKARLQAELDEARQRLTGQLQAAQEDVMRYKSTLSEMEVRLRAAEAEARAEAERRAAIENELQILRRQVENDRTQLGMRGEYEKVLTVLRSKLQARTDDLHAECLRRERAEEDAARLQESTALMSEQMAQREAANRAVIAEHLANEERLIRDAQDLSEQIRVGALKLQREHEKVIRLESAIKAGDDELRATQEALSEHRRALANMEAHTVATQDENNALVGHARDDSMRKKQLGYEVNRLTAENGRLTTAVKDLSLRLDAGDNARQRLEDELLHTRRDAQGFVSELEASRVKIMQLNEELRTLEGMRLEDRRTMAHEVQKMEDRLRCEGDDNSALAFANAQLSAEVTQLRAFAEAAQNRDRAEAINVDRHLHHLHTAADQMHSTLNSVVEAKRLLSSTRGTLPYVYGPPMLPATFGPDVPRLPVASPYALLTNG